MDAERVVRPYERGLTIKQVVLEDGYLYGTIRGVLHENGITMQSLAPGSGQESEQAT